MWKKRTVKAVEISRATVEELAKLPADEFTKRFKDLVRMSREIEVEDYVDVFEMDLRWGECFKQLTNEQLGQLLRAIYGFQTGHKDVLPEDEAIQPLFLFIKAEMEQARGMKKTKG